MGVPFILNSTLANSINESHAELVFSIYLPLYETLKQVQGDHFLKFAKVLF